MQVADFDFNLPNSLIAQYPTQDRTASRLLCLNRQTGEIKHEYFAKLLNYLTPNDLLVFNDTRVIPARLYGSKATGGKVEILVERILADNLVLAHVKASKAPRAGTVIVLRMAEEIPACAGMTVENAGMTVGAEKSAPNIHVAGSQPIPGRDDDRMAGVMVEVTGREDDLFLLQFPDGQTVLEVLEQFGHMPLPPYINRSDQKLDQERYQTVYAAKSGAVAAPTAGLHFDQELLAKIAELGVASAYVTLHVGAGTFQPVRVEAVTEHKMHSEYLEVSAEVCAKIKATQQKGGRVIAVGTTCVRSLETAARDGEIKPYVGDTDIFIYPGYKFNCVDALLTNFHLPRSTLLMLVAAFAGYDLTMLAYRAAVAECYRFFSYGDAMFIY